MLPNPHPNPPNPNPEHKPKPNPNPNPNPNQAFEAELRRRLVAGITVENGQSIVAIVGEGMAFRPVS